MEWLYRAALTLSRFGAIAGGSLLLAAAVIISADVLLRWMLNISIGGADELSGYALAIASGWGFSYALLQRAHIRVDSLYVQSPLRMRGILDLLALVGLTTFMGLVTWHGWGVLSQSIQSNARSISPLGAPLVIPQALWVAGLIFLMLVAALLMALAGGALLRGDSLRAVQILGPKSAAEEVSDELSHHQTNQHGIGGG